jgi:ribosome maturation factor RimP
MSRTNRIVDEVTDLVEPMVSERGLELVDVEYLSDRGRWVLRVSLDKEGGITLDDCAGVSRELAAILDVEEIIPDRYVLEVSSPGLNRPLKKESDFLRVIGKKIQVKTVAPIEGRQNFTGRLRDFREGTLILELEDRSVSLSVTEVKKANLEYEFDASGRAEH